MLTNQVADISIFSAYAIKHIAYIVAIGCLSYNIPQIFKIKAESGYMLRAGLMSAASLAMLPIFWVIPESYISFLDLMACGLCFSSGLFFSAYGSSKLQANATIGSANCITDNLTGIMWHKNGSIDFESDTGIIAITQTNYVDSDPTINSLKLVN